MLFADACLGGEGAAAWCCRASTTFDSTATIGCILEHLARSGKTISEVAANVPRYHMVKERIPVRPTVPPP